MNEEKKLQEIRNVDNILSRNVIGGLLNILNNKLRYEQVWSDKEVDELFVPFFYDMGSSGEDFIQDNYMFFEDVCKYPVKKIDGNFDIIPRGHIKYESSSIESSSITNRFVMGQYNKRNNKTGEVESYVSFLYSIPLKMSFNVEIRCDTVTNMFKIEQALREFFYKNKTYYVTFRGMRIGCRAGFPEQVSGKKPINYKMGNANDANEFVITFSINVETYQPIFDETHAILASHKMRGVGYEIKLKDYNLETAIGSRNEDNTIFDSIFEKELAYKDFGEIILKTNYENQIVSSATDLDIEWISLKDDGDMRTINLSYINEEGDKFLIDTVFNSSYYSWKLPNKLKNKPIDIMLLYHDNEKIVKKPEFDIIPDIETKQITADSFKVINGGFFRLNNESMLDSILFNIDMIDEKGNLITYENAGVINIINGQIDKDNPVSLQKKVYYKGEIKFNKIDLILEDALDTDIRAEIKNITIV